MGVQFIFPLGNFAAGRGGLIVSNDAKPMGLFPSLPAERRKPLTVSELKSKVLPVSFLL